MAFNARSGFRTRERSLPARCPLVARFLPASGTVAEPLGGFATLARRASR
ncbi:hypothetical protein BSU04_44835 [Caballeronia sordidicola]|uniref:Uncharacterized protein n=1 Tax=Caballeronia sordidicola TaxID=196367 RepID=A0A226WLD2_CABSO|nr:hypothetical protein BSU04_44835 [Caballeronia sordidicola]